MPHAIAKPVPISSHSNQSINQSTNQPIYPSINTHHLIFTEPTSKETAIYSSSDSNPASLSKDLEGGTIADLGESDEHNVVMVRQHGSLEKDEETNQAAWEAAKGALVGGTKV
jgi:hypothetical protein